MKVFSEVEKGGGGLTKLRKLGPRAREGISCREVDIREREHYGTQKRKG